MMTGKIGKAQKKVSRRMSGEATSPLMPVDLEEEEDVETRGECQKGLNCHPKRWMRIPLCPSTRLSVEG